MAISSPGSTSRTNDAPTMSRPAVSLETTQPRSRRPSTSGCTPCGSRAAYSVFSSANTRQKAPLSVGSNSIAAPSMPLSAAFAASSPQIRSESLDEPVSPACGLSPAAMVRSRSSAVLTRLPLCAKDRPLPVSVVRKIGCAFSQMVAPVVEYRQWPTAMWPCSDCRICSSKTWLTRPRSLKTTIWEPSETEMPAASWPRCCRA